MEYLRLKKIWAIFTQIFPCLARLQLCLAANGLIFKRVFWFNCDATKNPGRRLAVPLPVILPFQPAWPSSQKDKGSPMPKSDISLWRELAF